MKSKKPISHCYCCHTEIKNNGITRFYDGNRFNLCEKCSENQMFALNRKNNKINDIFKNINIEELLNGDS